MYLGDEASKWEYLSLSHWSNIKPTMIQGGRVVVNHLLALL
jgi:hypothetical protein